MNLPDLLVRLYKLGVRNTAMRAVQLTSNSMAIGWREKKEIKAWDIIDYEEFIFEWAYKI